VNFSQFKCYRERLHVQDVVRSIAYNIGKFILMFRAEILEFVSGTTLQHLEVGYKAPAGK
jgi:hypothetical protein